MGVAGVDAGGEFHQVAREEHALRRYPHDRVARGVPGAGLADLHFELAEPDRELAAERERRPRKTGNGMRAAEEPREAADLAPHVLRAALADELEGGIARNDVLGAIGRGAEHADGVVVREHDIADRLGRQLADAPDHLARHERRRLCIDHHHRVVADDHAGIGIALCGERPAIHGQALKADPLGLQIGLGGEGFHRASLANGIIAPGRQGGSMGRPEKIRLGDLLIAQKIISQEQLKIGLEQQKKSGRRLGRVLMEQGFVNEEQICEAISRQLNIPYVNLKFYNFNNDLVRRLPEAQARRFRAVVLEDRKNALLVGMADPTDLFSFDEIARLLRRDVEAAVVSEAILLQTIDRVYRRTDQISGLAKELERDVGEGYIDFGALGAGLGAEDAPVVKLLQSIFEDATQVNASDVHIEPQEKRLQIRFRIDGTLMPQTESDPKIAPALALRLKLMAGLDISEKRLP